MTDSFPPASDVVEIKAALTKAPTNLTIRDAIPVRRPRGDADDFLVAVRASTLLRCRKRLERMRDTRLELHDFAIGASMACLGAWISLEATTTPSSPGWLRQGLLVAGIAALVAYAFLKLAPRDTAKVTSADILEDLPDPNAIGRQDET